MSGAETGLLVFVFLAGAALLALWLHPRLPAAYRSKETAEIVRLGIGVVATTAAVVLGLLLSSVKSSFDQVNHDVTTFATELFLLDRTLRLYGPEANNIRGLLMRYTERAVAETWPASSSGMAVVEDKATSVLMDKIASAVRALSPDPRQLSLADKVNTAMRHVVRQRWILVGESGSVVSLIIVAALTFWLALVFASCGYNAPRNGLVVVVLIVCAAAIAGAFFLIVEMDGAFTGLIVVSDEPLRRTLTLMRG